MYYCEVHSNVGYVHLESIEHHCVLDDPDRHKAEIISRARVNIA
jgi:hypothetical protein